MSRIGPRVRVSVTFLQNTRRVLSYDVLRQQKTGVMTKGVVSGGSLTSSPAYNVEPVTNTRRRLVQTTNDGRRGVLDARRRPSRFCFSHFATSMVDNTVDLYAAKPDIRPDSGVFKGGGGATAPPPLV